MFSNCISHSLHYSFKFLRSHWCSVSLASSGFRWYNTKCFFLLFITHTICLSHWSFFTNFRCQLQLSYEPRCLRLISENWRQASQFLAFRSGSPTSLGSLAFFLPLPEITVPITIAVYKLLL